MRDRTPDNAPPRVLPIHACVPGRVRWHVRGLRGDPALKVALEAGLPELPGVCEVRASTDTGNLLTLFDPAVPLERVRERVVALVRGDAAAGPAATPGWHARPAHEVVAALRTSEASGLSAAEARWRSGLGSLGDLEEQRRQALSALNALVSLQQERAGALVALYRAAGGGWAREDALAAAPTPETR